MSINIINVNGVDVSLNATNKTDHISSIFDENVGSAIYDECLYTSDDGNEIYAKICSDGIFTKGIYDLSGNAITIETEKHPLYGKKISIIGDSISTHPSDNKHYYTITSVDVGKEIQSWVTFADVYKGSSTDTPTNKTIGGNLLTHEMIGTKQQFVPIIEDIGKNIGTPLNYNASSTDVWHHQLCRMTGATILSNSSWSGSQIVCGQGENVDNTSKKSYYSLSYSWSDFTVDNCSRRNDDGSIETPDVIFIYRGTNDMTHSPVGRIEDVQFSKIPSTDYVNDYRSFYVAYCILINKLRKQYPKSHIICCTLNYFNRSTDYEWTRHNSYYTLSEMNDCIRKIANKMSCGIVEFDKDGITAYTQGKEYYADTSTELGGTHPNTKGHFIMAKQAYLNTKNYNFDL